MPSSSIPCLAAAAALVAGSALRPATLATQPPVRVDHVEVVQVVQDLKQGVPLMAGKPAAVRVYLTAAAERHATGKIWVRWDASPLVPLAARAPIHLPGAARSLDERRATLGGSLDFIVPPGTGTLHVERLELYDARTGAALGCANCSIGRSLPFEEPPAMHLILIGYRYPHDGRLIAPRDIDFLAVERWIGTNFPVRLRVSRRYVNASDGWDGRCGSTNHDLQQLRRSDLREGGDSLAYYYALVSDERRRMDGCSVVIPSKPDPGVVASGPAGPAGVTHPHPWDTDGSYADWYAGHEIAHALGRKHVNEKCPGPHLDPEYPFRGGAISDATSGYVGWDMVTPPHLLRHGPVLRGTEWHDLMTYCHNQWVSAHTYRGLLRWLGKLPKMRRSAARAAEALPATALAGPPPRQDTLRWMLLDASVDTLRGTGAILTLTPAGPERPASAPASRSPVRVVVRDSAGDVVTDVPARVLESTAHTPRGGRLSISHVLPLKSSASRLQLVVGEAIVDSLLLAHRPPTIRGVDTAAVRTDEGQVGIEFTWEPDREGEQRTTYTVRVWFDGADVGETMAVGLRERRFVLDEQQRMGRAVTRVEIVASDGGRVGTFRSTRLTGSP